MVDKGDRYHLRMEIPGIQKDTIQLNATDDSIEISGEQSEDERGEDRAHNYIYNERSYNSFSRSIPIPEEVIPSKITAKMNNGILQVDVPKKAPSRPKYKNRNRIVGRHQIIFHDSSKDIFRFSF
jgi:HSP20 family protein